MTPEDYTRLLLYLREVHTVLKHMDSDGFTEDPVINTLAGGIRYDLDKIKERAEVIVKEKP